MAKHLTPVEFIAYAADVLKMACEAPPKKSGKPEGTEKSEWAAAPPTGGRAEEGLPKAKAKPEDEEKRVGKLDMGKMARDFAVAKMIFETGAPTLNLDLTVDPWILLPKEEPMTTPPPAEDAGAPSFTRKAEEPSEPPAPGDPPAVDWPSDMTDPDFLAGKGVVQKGDWGKDSEPSPTR